MKLNQKENNFTLIYTHFSVHIIIIFIHIDIEGIQAVNMSISQEFFDQDINEQEITQFNLKDIIKYYIHHKNIKKAIKYQELLIQKSVECDNGRDDTICHEYEYLSHMNTLAKLFHEISDFEESENVYNQIINSVKREFMIKPNDVVLSEILAIASFNLASLISNESFKRYSEAMKLYEACLGIYRQLYNENHHTIADILLHLADLYAKTSEYDLAKIRCEQSLKIFKNLNHISTISMTVNILETIIAKQVKQLNEEKFYAEASVLAQQCIPTLKSYHIISGYCNISLSLSNTNDRSSYQRAYLAVYPYFDEIDFNSKLCFVWQLEDELSAFSVKSMFKSISSLFDDTVVGSLVSTVMNGFDKQRSLSNTITDQTLLNTHDVSIVSVSPHVSDGVHQISISGYEIKSIDNQSEESANLKEAKRCPIDLSIQLESPSECTDWIDALQSYIVNDAV